MANVQKNLVVTMAVLGLMSGLSACSKFAPAARKTAEIVTQGKPTVSPSANPKNAAEENEATAKKLKEEEDKALAALSEPGLSAEERAKREEAAKKATAAREANDSLRAKALNSLTKEMDDAEAKRLAEQKAASETAKGKASDAVAKPAMTAASDIQAPAISEVLDKEGNMVVKGVTDVEPAGQGVADADMQFSAVEEQRLDFVLSLLPASVRFNSSIQTQRALLQKPAAQLSEQDKATIAELRTQYKVDASASIDVLLQHVNTVSFEVVAATIAVETAWLKNEKANADLLMSRMKELNVSDEFEKAAYRAKRAAGASTSEQLAALMMRIRHPAFRSQVFAARTEIDRLLANDQAKAAIAAALKQEAAR